MSDALGRIHHIARCVSDIEQARAFWTPLLCYLGYGEPALVEDRFYFFAGPGGGIGLWPQRDNPAPTPQDLYSPGLHHLSFAADSRAQVDAFHAMLGDIGAEIVDAPRAYQYMPGYYAVFFRDPDGVKFELCHTPGFPPA